MRTDSGQEGPLLGSASAAVRSATDGMSKPGRTDVEGLSKDCRSVVEALSKNCRTRVEALSKKWHGKAAIGAK